MPDVEVDVFKTVVRFHPSPPNAQIDLGRVGTSNPALPMCDEGEPLGSPEGQRVSGVRRSDFRLSVYLMGTTRHSIGQRN